MSLTEPLRGRAPLEVPLERAPLVRVLSQLTFDEVLSIGKREFVAGFQEKLRSRYPVLRDERIIALGSPEERRIWRFSDATNTWRVSLTTDFVTIETARYTSRVDFVGRIAEVSNALECFNIHGLRRLGVRYVDHVVGEEFKRIHRLVRLGFLGVLAESANGDVSHVISEMSASADEGTVMARWGLLPPNGTFDPSVLAPIGEPSWFFDVDVFTLGSGEPSQPIPLDHVHAVAGALATRAYSMFRWAVTDEFLTTYGGKVS